MSCIKFRQIHIIKVFLVPIETGLAEKEMGKLIFKLRKIATHRLARGCFLILARLDSIWT